MVGFDDNVVIMGDWVPPSPSPRAFFSSILGDDPGSRLNSDLTNENKTGALVLDPESYVSLENSYGKGPAQVGAAAGDQTASLSLLSEQKMSSRGGLLERMAARAGFNAPRLNTESIRPPDHSQNQEVRSPYLTIPPGLSPTTLLESPVFLSNSLVQPSPTTGKFSFPSSGENQNSILFMDASGKSKECSFSNNDPSFAFKPIIQTGPSLFPGAFSKVTPSSSALQPFPRIKIQSESESSIVPPSAEPTRVYTENGTLQQPDLSGSSIEKVNITSEPMTFNAVDGSLEHSPPPDEEQDEDADERGSGDSKFLGTPSEDGFNWRKYGQKHVKGSEYPRSYYKCTHPSCPVKKKVERSQDGQITEIIYRGAHNHPMPLPNRRSALGPTNALTDLQLENTEQAGSRGDGDPTWANMQKGSGAVDSDWRIDNLEVTSAPLGSQYCNGSSLPAHNITQLESGDAVNGSSTFSNDEDEDDRGTRGSVSLGYDGEGESESKRRKIETYAAEMSGATRAIREPRVVVQTTSEVDILDDGYRWRKYGQKVVKGNPNPRSYYKCTSAGCTVRKHVERASHDLKSVITTYEGKHNHDVPAARNSSHVNSGLSSSQTTALVQSHLHRPEPLQLQNAMARFEGPPLSLGSFGLPQRPQLGAPSGFGFRMNPPGLTNMGMAGFEANQGTSPLLPVHPFVGQQRPVNDMSFILSKPEPKMEPVADPGLNISNTSSVYQQVMNSLPLGPHI